MTKILSSQFFALGRQRAAMKLAVELLKNPPFCVFEILTFEHFAHQSTFNFPIFISDRVSLVKAATPLRHHSCCELPVTPN
jgi:hypothetical protein